MADKNSGWACTHSATITSQDNSGAYIEVICYWQNQGWRYDMNGVSAWVYCGGQSYQVKSSSAIDTTGNNQAAYEMGRHTFYVSKTTASQSLSCYAKITSTSSYVSGTKSSGASTVTVSAKPSYTVSYNANGGSGAPGSQTKWYGTDLTLSSTKPTRTGHTFNGWATSASGAVAYQPGGKYTANAGVTLYAKWTAHTYTVTYNANGGSGAPGNQTKTYGVNLTLSSTKPTRTDYNFLGWATSAGGSVVYAAGATYAANAAVTLYAVWQLAYKKPRITNFTANRCTSNGTVSETGTYIKVSFGWATDKTVTAVKAQHKLHNAYNWTDTAITASGTSATPSVVIGGGGISTENSYVVRVYVSDSGGTTYSTEVSIGTVKFPIDVKSGGTGVAIGKVAEKNAFEVGMDTWMGGKVLLTSNPPNFGACRDVTVQDSYVRLFTFRLEGAWKSASAWFTLTDAQYNNENLLCSLWIHRTDTTLSVYGFNYMSTNSGFSRSRLIAVVTSNMTVEVYFKMKASDSPAVSIISMTKLFADDYAYGKIILDCSSTTTSLPSGTQTTVTGFMMGKKTLNSVSHSGYGTSNEYLIDTSFISYWNGAYDSNNTSNLKYCSKGGIRGNSHAQINWGRQTISCTAWAQRSFGNVSSSSASGRFTISGNNVVVGSGVTKVKVTAHSVGFHPGSGGDRVTYIKIGTAVYDLKYESAGSSWGCGGSGSIIATVSQGTNITAVMCSGITQSIEHLGAWLQVEDIT